MEGIMLSKRLAILAGAAAALAAPAMAGEITGNGKPVEINSRSECAYSGLNDNTFDPRDPGLKTQNYGSLVRIGRVNPQNLDPTAPFFQPIPGFACNPNRWTDLHDDD
jgi:hypothetical protein